MDIIYKKIQTLNITNAQDSSSVEQPGISKEKKCTLRPTRAKIYSRKYHFVNYKLAINKFSYTRKTTLNCHLPIPFLYHEEANF